MWTRIPREDGNAPKISDNFKLAEKRVPQDVAQSVALPMTHIWRGAVQFDQDQRYRQMTAALNKPTDQQTLAAAFSLTAYQTEKANFATPRTDGTKANWPATANRQVRSTQGSSRGTTGASPVGYGALGNKAKPASGAPERLGAVLDLRA
jgi:hypothetical protein